MPARLTTSIFVTRSNVTHCFKYDYSLVDYMNSQTKVKIICPIHGEFNQRAADHLNGRGCSECGVDVNKGSDNDFVYKSLIVHGSKYNYSLTNYKGVNEKVKIICPIHGGFMQTPKGHLSGNGCPVCWFESMRFTTSDFIKNSIIKHGHRYDYSKVSYIDKRSKVWITCPEHGEFSQDAGDHMRGHGCPSCSVSGFKRKDDGTLYILRSRCGLYFKAGISNNVNKRLSKLRNTTPFDFEQIAKINHSGDVVFELEKAFHSSFQSAQMKGFDGCTEWFRWDAIVNDWIALLIR